MGASATAGRLPAKSPRTQSEVTSPREPRAESVQAPDLLQARSARRALWQGSHAPATKPDAQQQQQQLRLQKCHSGTAAIGVEPSTHTARNRPPRAPGGKCLLPSHAAANGGQGASEQHGSMPPSRGQQTQQGEQQEQSERRPPARSSSAPASQLRGIPMEEGSDADVGQEMCVGLRHACVVDQQQQHEEQELEEQQQELSQQGALQQQAQQGVSRWPLLVSPDEQQHPGQQTQHLLQQGPQEQHQYRQHEQLEQEEQRRWEQQEQRQQWEQQQRRRQREAYVHAEVSMLTEPAGEDPSFVRMASAEGSDEDEDSVGDGGSTGRCNGGAGGTVVCDGQDGRWGDAATSAGTPHAIPAAAAGTPPKEAGPWSPGWVAVFQSPVVQPRADSDIKGQTPSVGGIICRQSAGSGRATPLAGTPSASPGLAEASRGREEGLPACLRRPRSVSESGAAREPSRPASTAKRASSHDLNDMPLQQLSQVSCSCHQHLQFPFTWDILAVTLQM